MTRGGKRKGAGRPRTTLEKKTVPLPVRVTPIQLVAYKQAAAVSDKKFGEFVRDCMDRVSADILGRKVW